MGPQTKLIHGGERAPDSASRALTTPIYETATFAFNSAADVERYQEGTLQAFLYSRYENPTVVATETKLAAADGAEQSLALQFGNGGHLHGADHALSAGDEVICASAIYGGTFHLIEHLLPRFGVTRRFVSLEELRAPAAVLGPKTKVLWFESPINPTLRCVDVRAVAEACRKAGVLSAIDNTFASSANQQPLAMGVDLSMQSTTKYLNGHSDVTGGVLSGSKALLEPIGKTRRLLGGVIDPQPAYALGRGLKTLSLRIARHNANAQAVAEALEGASARLRGCTTRVWLHIPTTRSRNGRWRALAAWSASISKAGRRRRIARSIG